jgi:heat shock protein HslJ
MFKRVLILLGWGTVLLGLAGCQPVQPLDPDGSTTHNPAPAGAEAAQLPALETDTWQLTAVADSNGTLAPVPAEVTATAAFAQGMLSGQSGCNQYGAAYTLENTSLQITPGPMTLMACLGPQMQIEQDFLAALAATETYQIQNNQLSLVGSNGQTVATFVPQVDASLAGNDWVVTAYASREDAVVSVLLDTRLTALFAADGLLSGSAGCNQYHTTYTTDGTTIALSPIATTRRMCAAEVMAQENAFLAALEETALFQIEGNRLELHNAEGTLLVVFSLANNE